MGCAEAVKQMGFNINFSEEISKKNAELFLDKSDIYDINCAQGTSFPIPPAKCPLGYVEVPGNPTKGLGGKNNTEGVSSFYVAKYEMKCSESDLSNQECNDRNVLPQSKPENTPWTELTRNQARNACERLGKNYGLMSVPERIAIARNIESVASNWSGGNLGLGKINQGHTDNSSGILEASVDINPYFMTGNHKEQAENSGWEQKRTFVLSNGEVLWDFAGNAGEYLYEDTNTLGLDSYPQMDPKSSEQRWRWNYFSDVEREVVESFGPSMVWA